jgi:hypothetical protein
MSTRVQIAIQIGPDKWAHVYVHFDGYPAHMLSDDHFNTHPDEINWDHVGTLNHFFGCRPLCKKFLTLLTCDRVRSSFRPRKCGLSRSRGPRW